MYSNFSWKYLTREAGPERLIPVLSLNVSVEKEAVFASIQPQELTVNVVSSIEAHGQDNLFAPITQGI